MEGGRSLGRKTGKSGIDRRIGRWSEPRSWSTSQEQEKARVEGAKEMSGEERLPEERWRRVGASGSLRGRRSEEMTQSNTSSPRKSGVGSTSWVPEGVMAIEVPQNKEISPINSRLNVVVRSSTPFGLGRNGCWPSRGSQLPRALPLQRFAFTNCKTVVCSISFVSNVVGWSNADFFWHHAIVFASFYGVATQILYFRDGLFAWLQICNEKMNSSVSVLVNVAVDFISMKACIVYDVNLYFAVTCKDKPCGEHESCTGPNLCTCDDGFRSIDGNCTSEEVFNWNYLLICRCWAIKSSI